MTHQPGPVEVTAGVDTHTDTHMAAALDQLGRPLGTRQFPATIAGYRALLAWLQGLGTLTAVGVEGTGSYGAGLARHLHDHAVPVIEIDRPDRKDRRRHGKTDTLDAIAAARAVQSGRATAVPKARTGPVEAIRVLRSVRRSAIQARTAALNELTALLVTAPETLRAQLHGLNTTALVTTCAGLRPGTDLTCPLTATKTALRRLARRIQQLSTEITDADTQLTTLVPATAPRTTALFGFGPDTAGQLLTTAGDNPTRLHSEAAYAHLCGTAPIPAASGRTTKHRLNRAGDRQANAALHRIVIVRMRHCPRTRAYVTRRTTEGLSKRDIIRCLKRYAAREAYHAIQADLANLTT
ncbi:IS110 family transposase [Prauserella sp. PE36]|uniref:IS110 family transposase n=1 Tax=Prauserella sp. PE36 TaxID=1504709 RepID=UPI000D953A93|nr:IS110 family transposase [Prauserella sp. PE36]PXY34481.1 transposase [Prauserella coralliicola]RBM20180.1 IS110 family transposase [Prauserella sp. PE36]